MPRRVSTARHWLLHVLEQMHIRAPSARSRARVSRTPGFDGQYGTVQLLSPDEIESLNGQISFFSSDAPHPEASARRPRKTDAPQKSSGAKPSAPVQTAHSKLNPEQQKAVCAVEPAVAVIAGPGTGKTKTLVSRAVHLLCEKQVSPRQLTAVTFTNKAAREMRERLTAELDKDRTIGDLTIGTFHSICLLLLRETGKAVTLLQKSNATAQKDQLPAAKGPRNIGGRCILPMQYRIKADRPQQADTKGITICLDHDRTSETLQLK